MNACRILDSRLQCLLMFREVPFRQLGVHKCADLIVNEIKLPLQILLDISLHLDCITDLVWQCAMKHMNQVILGQMITVLLLRGDPLRQVSLKVGGFLTLGEFDPKPTL